MDCMQYDAGQVVAAQGLVSIPQAVWIACNARYAFHTREEAEFQYRKRYELHAMDKVNLEVVLRKRFQYRKRYGLHAIC